MTSELFDQRLRSARRDRAFRQGAALFVHERAFDDICERLGEVARRFDSALLIGTMLASAPQRLGRFASMVQAVEPGAAFAKAAGARHSDEVALDYPPGGFDLVVAPGTLDTLGDLPGMLHRITSWMTQDALLIGWVPGGDTLPRLRSAMRAADSVRGLAAPHVHPRIEAAALGALLGAAGFVMPVVDVDRVPVAYLSLRQLVADLRAMAATNVLRDRPRALSKAALAAAEAQFAADAGPGSRTVETFELLHFAAWTRDHG